MPHAANKQTPRRAAGGSTRAEPATDRAWLLSWGRRTKGSALGGGMVGALIVGALALVVALMALTVAIGRAATDDTADTRPTVSVTAAAAPTSFESPEQTGKRWSPDPIITGVPQNQPSYEPTPSATEAETPADETPAEETVSPEPTPGEVSVEQEASPENQPPPAEASVGGRNPDATERPGRP